MLSGIRDAIIIHNPTAGWRRRRHDLEAARDILRRAGIEAELQGTAGKGSATQLAHEAVRQRRQLVIACGGDGTINEVVNGLAGSLVPLAVLPAGTANVLAKELGLPWDIRAAAEMIPKSSLRRIALGLAASTAPGGLERYLLCVGGAGPDGSMMYLVSEKLKERIGILAYWLEGLRHLFAYRLPGFQVTAAGRRVEATLLVVSRSKHYGGPFRITTGASLFEDSFELAAFTTRNRFCYLLYPLAVWLGLLRRMRGVHFWKATTVRCEPNAGDTVYVQVDGEAIGTLPMEFRIVPDALTLVIPEGCARNYLAVI